MTGLGVIKIKKLKLSIRGFMISYLVILIPIIIVVNIVFYTSVIPVYEDEIINMNKMSLINYKMLFDRFMTDVVEDIYLEVILDENNNGYMRHLKQNPETDLWGVSIVHEQLLNIVKANDDFLQSISIYYEDNQFVNSSNGLKFLNKKDGQNMFQYYWLDQLDFQGKDQLFASREIIDYTRPYEIAPVVSWVKSVPYVEDQAYQKGAIVFNIKESFINKMINENIYYEKQDVAFYMIDKKGNYIFRNKEDKDLSVNANKLLEDYFKNGEDVLHIKDKNNVISVAMSGNEEIFYVFSVPKTSFFYKSNTIKNQIILFTVFILLCTLIVTYIVSRKTYNPIKEMANSAEIILSYLGAKNNHKSNDDYSKIQSTMTILSKRIKKNIPIIKYSFYNELIENRFNASLIEEKMKFLNIVSVGNYYKISVVYLRIQNKDITERETIRFSILEYIENMNDNKFSVYAMARGGDKIIIISNFKELRVCDEKIVCISNYVENIIHREGYDGFITSGLTYTDIRHLWQSYKEAKKLKQYYFVLHQPVLDYVKLGKDENTPYRPLFNKDKLKQLINGGKTEKIDEFLNGLINKIKAQRIPYDHVMRVLMEVLTVTENCILVSHPTLDRNYFKDLFVAYNNLSHIDEFKDVYVAFINRYSEYTEQQKEAVFNDVMIKIIDYIDNNINESISLRELSERFHISYSYLSTLFKQSTGKSFSLYVREKKIEKAIKLLNETNDTIEKIAKEVGINDTGYFIKQFKKYYGITPRQYRLKNSHNL